MLLPFGRNNNYLKFIKQIYNSLNEINLNEIVPTEEEFRFKIASIIQNWIDAKDKVDMNKIIMTLERQSTNRSKIDIVIFYYPKIEKPFAEIIELKRGGKDKPKDRKKTDFNRYYFDIRKGSIAEDLKKLIFRISQSESIYRKLSTDDRYLPEEIPITSGLFLWLSPIQKKRKRESEEFKKEILYGGIEFWKGKGKRILEEKNGKEVDIIQPQKSFINIMKGKEQEVPEFFEYFFIKRKN